MDIDKQLKYWKTGAAEDMLAAETLLEKGHLRHCLFFAHLALEKALKAHVINSTHQIPPRIHNLARLAELADISLTAEQKSRLLEFGVYQLEGRYPDSQQLPLDVPFVTKELERAKETLEWLTAIL
jgi:HEPN domain-containing protein